jgi:hypothetical protein
MEFDNAHEVPSWTTMKITKNKLIVEELSHDGPTIF